MRKKSILMVRSFIVILVAFMLGITLPGCGGSPKKAEPPVEEKGSLSRTFTIVDEQGRKSGTITVDFGGNAVLRDEHGEIIGKFRTEEPLGLEKAPSPAGSEAAEKPSEPAQSQTQSGPETSTPDAANKQ